MKIHVAVLDEQGYCVTFVDGFRHGTLCGMIDYDVTVADIVKVTNGESFEFEYEYYELDEIDDVFSKVLKMNTLEEFLEFVENVETDYDQ